jgi:hypothetical protein
MCDRLAMTEASVLLLGCVATKRPYRARAKDLYCSPLWSGRRRYAESTCRPWFVVSALHGLVEPEEYLEPYDPALTDLTAAARRIWGDQVIEALALRVPLAHSMLEVHAGSAYRAAIHEPLRRRGARMVVPLAGLGLGQQLAWYRSR